MERSARVTCSLGWFVCPTITRATLRPKPKACLAGQRPDVTPGSLAKLAPKRISLIEAQNRASKRASRLTDEIEQKICNLIAAGRTLSTAELRWQNNQQLHRLKGFGDQKWKPRGNPPTTHRKLTYEIQQKTFGPFPDLYLLDVSVGFWVTTLVPLSSRSVCSFFGSMARVRFWKTIEFLLNPSEGFRSGRVE